MPRSPEVKVKALRKHVQNAIRRGRSYRDDEMEAIMNNDDVRACLKSEPLITVEPDEPEKGIYTVFSQWGIEK